VASVIRDAVTTTDELIPSGETSSYRSNPERLAEFTLSRKDPAYVGRAKAVRERERARLEGQNAGEYQALSALVGRELNAQNTGIGSVVFANKPGDGSAREQAASCQKVLGGWANIALEYATKRYRSNLVNWGMLPLLCNDAAAQKLEVGDRVLLSGIRASVEAGAESISAQLIKKDGSVQSISLSLPLMDNERPIILSGCLMNYYAGN
jgi:aconitate hydratase